jgi:3-oxoadipate enol-lactonase
MPMIDADGCLLNVSVEGRQAGPTLMLSNSLGTTMQMWEPQMKALTQVFRVIRYDRRGHGKSGVPAGPYSMERFGRDVLAILDDLNIDKVHWCGLSMGGMVGQWLGANAPDRVDKLILSNCTDYYADKGPWNDRIKVVREKGLAHIVSGNMERWFTKGFRDQHPEVIARFTEMFLATKLDGYIACGQAVRDMDHRALLPKIKAPTLIIAGRHDPSTTLAMGESMRDRIPGAKLAVIDAAHISNAEQPQAYTETVLNFLAG